MTYNLLRARAMGRRESFLPLVERANEGPTLILPLQAFLPASM